MAFGGSRETIACHGCPVQCLVTRKVRANEQGGVCFPELARATLAAAMREHRLLVAVEGGGVPDPVEAAWSYAMDGFAQALRVKGLPATERACLERCYRNAAAACRQHPELPRQLNP